MAIQANRTGRALATVAAYILLSTASLVAANWTWDGGGLNNNWTTALNWDSGLGRDTAPDNDGTADIVMAGTTRLTPRVDVDWDINSLTFNNTAGGFSISGDPGVSLGIGPGGITNNDTQTQILLLPIDLNASQTWNAAAGPLSIGNTIAGHLLLSRTLTLDGTNNIQIAGAITNATNVNKAGTGTVTFNGLSTNSYTGTTTVSAGTLALGRTGGPNRAIPGNLVIGDGAGGAVADVVRLDAADQITETAGRIVTINSSGLLNLNGFNETLADLAINGGSVSGAGALTVNESLTFTGGGSVTAETLTVNGAISSTASPTSAMIAGGTINLGGAAKTFTVADGAAQADLMISSTLTGGGLTKDGPGTLLLTSSNVLPLPTVVNNGVLHISSGGQLSNDSGDVGETFQSQATATVHGAGSAWNIANRLTVGKLFSSQGTLNIIEGGAVTSTEGRLGDGVMVGGSGVVNVDGIGSAWNNSGTLYVGRNGHGTLNITSGGTVTSGFTAVAHQSTGAVTVDGPGSVWNVTGALRIGIGDFLTAGHGSLTISNGGLVNSTGDTIVGLMNEGQSAIVSVDGPGSAWNHDGVLTLGWWELGWEGGNVELNVANGGTVTSGDGFVVGSVSVDGDDSNWDLTGSLDLFRGPLDITGGGSVSAASVRMNEVIATIDGSGSSLLVAGDLDVGTFSSPISTQLVIQSGAVVTSANGYVGRKFQNATPMGRVAIDGLDAKWAAANDIHVGFDSSGTLTVTSGGTAEVGNQLIVGALGQLHGNGNIVGDVVNHGLVSPGNSGGALHVDGSYSQSASGKLTMELASETIYDQLIVAADLNLDGTLRVEFAGMFAPGFGQEFQILSFAALDGAFSALELPALSDTLEWDVSRLYTNGVISISGPGTLFGDYNANGTADAADYVVWRKTIGQLVPAFSGADGNGNGAIDVGDYGIWRANFGRTAGATAGLPSSVVPEPASIALLLFACFGLLVLPPPDCTRASRLVLRGSPG